MKRRIIALVISVALLLSLAIPAAAAPPQDNPGKAPEGLTKTVFVHYPKGVMAKGGIPGPPGGGGNGGGDDGKEGKQWYKWGGEHWLSDTVEYIVEDDVSVGRSAAIDKAFLTWEQTGASIDFLSGVPGNFGEPSSFGTETANGANEIAWIGFDQFGLPSNAIAVTAVWVFTGTTIIAEVDMAFNDDLPWSTTGEAGKYDTENIAAHEAGHWLMLRDMYNNPAREQTMYGYGALGEVKKQTLESGDIAGVLAIYP
jgi:hypothetical protein